MYSKKIRIEARQKFIAGLPLTTVAKMMNISPAALKSWKAAAFTAGDDWDGIRDASMFSAEAEDEIGKNVLEKLNDNLNLIINEVDRTAEPEKRIKMLASVADSHAKIVRSYERLAPKIKKLSIALETIKVIGNTVREESPKHAHIFEAILDKAGKALTKKFGDE